MTKKAFIETGVCQCLSLKSNMNRLKVNFTFCEAIQMFMVFIVYGWFFYFSWISYSEFQNEMTGISQFLTPAKDLLLPTITVCSEEIFKNVSEETS